MRGNFKKRQNSYPGCNGQVVQSFTVVDGILSKKPIFLLLAKSGSGSNLPIRRNAESLVLALQESRNIPCSLHPAQPQLSRLPLPSVARN